MGKLLKFGTLIPVNLFNNTFYLTNIDFLPSYIAHFYVSIILPFLVFTTFAGFFCIFSTL